MNHENIQPSKAYLYSIVVIDDEEDILKSLKSLFRQDKYKMYFFTSGVHALEFLKYNSVDVIISDMRMPEISGAEILKKSVDINPHAIRIILSGFEEKQVVLNAIQRGVAQHYIMKPWDDMQLREIVKESMKLQKDVRKKHLQEILYSFNNLPSPPKLHSKLVNILEADVQSQKQIAKEIEKSPALVAKLLRISNSVFYGARIQISSVYEAITFIGTEFVLNIVLGLESFESIKGCNIQPVMQMVENIREISILRAHLAREIAVRWSLKNEQHEIYVAALLLDIGLILRLCSYNENDKNYYETFAKRRRPIYLVDKELHSTTHDEVGAALLTYWNFPSRIISAVSNHHSYTGDDTFNTIIQLADALTERKDSYPHDPGIDEYLREWEPKMNPTIEELQETSNIYE